MKGKVRMKNDPSSVHNKVCFWRLPTFIKKIDFRRGFLLKEVKERRVHVYLLGDMLANIFHDVSGAIVFIWASVIDLYNRLKPGLSLAEISGEEEGGFTVAQDLQFKPFLKKVFAETKSTFFVTLSNCETSLFFSRNLCQGQAWF